ncbi:MAG: NAD kinase [Varibaculum sp.]|nr:NAD kinase [Varibaculum sp.]
MNRKILVIRHSHRHLESADYLVNKIREAGIEVSEYRADDTVRLGDNPIELVLATGGDGTMLKSAEYARQLDVPLLGINTGHMGFLTEADVENIDQVITAVIECTWTITPRMTLDISVSGLRDGKEIQYRDWALNEAALLATDRAHPAHMAVGIDDNAISNYGADGMIVATPTGSTAYSFSAGGPVVWPDVEAVLVTPLAAHGLFTRPMVISPESKLDIKISPNQYTDLELWCDGIRSNPVAPDCEITITRGSRPIKLAQISDTPFSGRLVHKFNLPVQGWLLP